MSRIYVASLSDYNAGRLHGAWIDLDGKDADDVREEVAAMLKESREAPAEEWAIHDFEGFGAYKVDEHDSFAGLCEVARLIDSHGEIVTHAIADGLCDVSSADAYMGDHYSGAWKSLEDYAEETIGESIDLDKLPDVIRHHIDWEGIARDLVLGGDVSTVDLDGEIHVFTC